MNNGIETNEFCAARVPNLLHRYLDLASSCSPVIRRTIENFGGASVSRYVQTLIERPNGSFQPRDDLAEVIRQQVAPLLGDGIAQTAAAELMERPVVMTANHHGVDFFSQSVQGSLLFALGCKGAHPDVSAVIVLSCGNIPLNNLTYPMGILLYQVPHQSFDAIPKRLPILANRLKRCVVSAVEGYDRGMAERAVTRVGRMAAEGEISSQAAQCVERILQQDYLDPAISNLPSYSQQAVVLNSRLWKRLFANAEDMPDLVYLEIEKVAAGILEKDLQNPDSLAWQVMFKPLLRERVLDSLEGHRTCWDRNHLRCRLHCGQNVMSQELSANGCGTVFFWSVDDSARKFPLHLDGSMSGREVLCGVDDSGNLREFQFTPDEVIRGLREGKLIPSLFTSYLTVSLARNVIALGGYYQAEYLPAIQRGLLKALAQENAPGSLMQTISEVSTNKYLSGMQTVMAEVSERHLVPAGPIEMMAHGGLKEDDLHRIGQMPVREAHFASLLETLADITPGHSHEVGWKTALASECYHHLHSNVVTV